jgi:hypothetical protein
MAQGTPVVYPKACPQCDIERQEDDYPLDPSRLNGRHPYCKDCKSAYMREFNDRRREDGRLALENLTRACKKYGITVEDYYRTLDEQDGRCAICGTEEYGRVGATRFSLDHCHDSGRFRALLCNPCNLGLGAFTDSPTRLRDAATYIERFTN